VDKGLHGSRCHLVQGRPRFTRHCVTWGPSSPPLKGHSPQFSVNVHCGQMAGWTKIPLGVEVGLGPGNFVFDGEPATPRKKGTLPDAIFGPCLLWPNGWMDEDSTCYRSRPQPTPHCIRWGPRSPTERRTAAPLFLADVGCGHSCSSQPLLSSCHYCGRESHDWKLNSHVTVNAPVAVLCRYHIICFSAHQSALSSQYSTCCVWGLCAENQFKTAAAWSELKIGFMY